jgi:uncharacterized delta-60 repeat protein
MSAIRPASIAAVTAAAIILLAPSNASAVLEAAQPSGKVLVTVQRKGGEEVARLNRNGELDHSFGKRGLVKIGDRGARYLTGLIVGPAGKISVSGRFRGGAYPNQFVVQLTKKGDLDRNFGDDGISQPFLNRGFIQMGGLALTPDGSLVVAAAGGDCNGCNSRQLVARMTGTGQPDLTFGDEGVAEVPTQSDQIDVTVTPDGRIVTGTSQWVARLLSDGSLDASFGGGTGYIELDFPVDGIAPAPDGGMYAGGARGGVLGATAILSDGSIDESFANGGIFSQGLGEVTGGTGTVLRAADGSLLIAAPVASHCVPAHPSQPNEGRCHLFVGVMRVNIDGSLDPSFGTDGVATVGISRSRRIFQGGVQLIESRDGLRVATPIFTGPSTSPGLGAPDQPTGVAVAALASDGSLDRRYGKNGFSVISTEDR